MIREEKQKAIDALKISAPIMVVTQEEFKDYIQTLNKIMDWLEQEPIAKNDLGVDAISRAEVLKIFDEWFATCDIADKKDSPKAKIKALPSVTPQEPRIITCKDCKYYRNKRNKRSYCTKRLNVDSVTDRYREPNFYCADAALREVKK